MRIAGVAWLLTTALAAAASAEPAFELRSLPGPGRTVLAELVDLDGDGRGDLLSASFLALPPKDVRRRTLQRIDEAFRHVSRSLGVFGQEPEAFLERRRTRLCQVRGIDPERVEQLIGERADARKAKDFSRADDIRGELTQLGVELMDSPTGTTWRVTEPTG